MPVHQRFWYGKYFSLIEILENQQSVMEKLKSIILKNDTKGGRIFDLCIQFLIVLSVVCFSIETLPDLDDSTIKVLKILEVIVVILFTVEYLLRIVLSEKRFKFIFSFYGIIDLAAILPFYLATGLDFRSVRALRLLRVFRILKLVKYSAAINRFVQALKSIKRELIMFFAMTLIMIYLAGAGIYFFENSAQPEAFTSIFDSLWWAIVTLTTVGYGDIYPITVGGKIFTFFILIIGLGIVAIPTGLFASALTKTKDLS